MPQYLWRIIQRVVSWKENIEYSASVLTAASLIIGAYYYVSESKERDEERRLRRVELIDTAWNVIADAREEAKKIHDKIQKSSRLYASTRDFGQGEAIATLRELGLSFSMRDLSYLRLVNLSLQNIEMIGTVFDYADLSSSLLSNTRAFDARFNNSLLNDAVIQSAGLNGAQFREAELKNADLSFSTLSHVDFNKADLRCSRLERSVATDASFFDADLRSSDLRSMIIRGSLTYHKSEDRDYVSPNVVGDLSEADLENANMSGTEVIRIRMNNVNMNGVILHGTIFEDVDMTMAKNLSNDQLSYSCSKGKVSLPVGLSPLEQCDSDVEWTRFKVEIGRLLVRGTLLDRWYHGSSVKRFCEEARQAITRRSSRFM